MWHNVVLAAILMLLLVNVIVSIILIGKPRDPNTAGGVISGLIINMLLAVGIAWLAGGFI